MARLFFALWPDDEVRSRLAAAIHALPSASGRPVPVRNLHITLVFLGDVTGPVQAVLLEGAAALRGPRFDLALSRCGGFRRTGVAWLAPETVPAAVIRLVADLTALCRQAGLAPDTRPYEPHLTIARKCRRVQTVEFPAVCWPVTDFALVESQRSRAGSEYQVLARWPLVHEG